MAAGDCCILRETTAGETSNSTSYSDYDWDTEVYRDAGSFTLSGTNGVTCLNAGPKLVIYNNSYLGSGTNRSELRNRIEVDGVGVLSGQSSGFIRRNQDSYSAQCGIGIIETASANEVVSIARARTDSNTAGATCTRIADESGFSIVELDDSWAYFRGSDNTSQSLTHASGESPPVTAASYEWQDVLVRTEDRKDTGYTHSTTVNPAEIELLGARRYLICYSITFQNTSGSVRVNGLGRLVYNGVQVPASLATAYARGSDGCQDPVACGAVIFSPTARNKVLRLQAACDQEGTGTLNVEEVAISIVDLGLDAGADVAVLRQSADHDHNVARTAFDAIEWDTQDVLDTDSFGHSTSTDAQHLESLNGGRILAFSGYFHVRTAINTVRKRPRVKFRVFDGASETDYKYGLGDNYNRGDQGATSTFTAGGVAGGVFDLNANELLSAGGCDPASAVDNATAWAADDCALFAIDLASMVVGGVGQLEGTAGGSGGVSSATLAGFGDLDGSAAGQGFATGELDGAGALAGTAAGSATLTGDLAAAGSIGDLVGSAAGSGALAGAIVATGDLAASAAGSSTATGALEATGALASTAAGASTATASLGGLAAMVGTSSGNATAVGAMQAVARVPIPSVAAGTSTATGALTGTGALSGSGAGISTATGALGAEGTLAATVAGSSTAAGALDATGVLAATASGTSTGTAALVGAGALSATAAGSATTVGDLAGAGALAGVAAGSGALAGSLIGIADGALNGTAAGSATAAGAITATANASGTGSGSATAAASLSGALAAFGSAQASSLLVGSLEGLGTLAAIAAGLALATGDLSNATSGSIRGTASSNATATGLLSGLASLSGLAAGSSTATASAGAVGPLAGSTDGSSTASAALSGLGGLDALASSTATATGLASAIGSLVALAQGVGSMSASIGYVGFTPLRDRQGGLSVYETRSSALASRQEHQAALASYLSLAAATATFMPAQEATATYDTEEAALAAS